MIAYGKGKMRDYSLFPWRFERVFLNLDLKIFTNRDGDGLAFIL